MHRCTGYDRTMGRSRREILARFGMGLGAMALARAGKPSCHHGFAGCLGPLAAHPQG